MTHELLTQYVEAGLPQFRKAAKLPEWLAPEQAKIAREVGDEVVLKLAEPLGLAEQLKSFLAQAPEANTVPIETWQEALGRWQVVDQSLPVATTLLRIGERLRALKRRGELRVDPVLFCRALAAISYSPFVPNGKGILKKLAEVLGSTVEDPAVLLELYLRAVIKGNEEILGRVNKCVQEGAGGGL